MKSCLSFDLDLSCLSHAPSLGYHDLTIAMAAPPTVKVMFLLEILHGICDMEEMKKSSPATKDVSEDCYDREVTGVDCGLGMGER